MYIMKENVINNNYVPSHISIYLKFIATWILNYDFIGYLPNSIVIKSV